MEYLAGWLLAFSVSLPECSQFLRHSRSLLINNIRFKTQLSLILSKQLLLLVLLLLLLQPLHSSITAVGSALWGLGTCRSTRRRSFPQKFVFIKWVIQFQFPIIMIIFYGVVVSVFTQIPSDSLAFSGTIGILPPA